MNNITKNRLGKGGKCICPKCNTIVNHEKGIPCHDTKCQECGAKMLRVGSDHHKQWLKKKNNN